MQKGNVLVLGNSGVGKSTLINAVLGENVARTGWGTKGTTEHLEIYENAEVPFRIIDSVGFELSLLKRRQAINAVKKWSKDCAKAGHEDNQINVVWFCVSGVAAKLFAETVRDLCAAVSSWPAVPIVAVITKSYGTPDRERNIEMVKDAFHKSKCKNPLKAIIPVVAQEYRINEEFSVAPEGIDELVECTNSLIPEGMKAAADALKLMVLNGKRAQSQATIAATALLAAAVGVAPIPISDGFILTPLETSMIRSLASIYRIPKNEDAKKFAAKLVECGTVGVLAKALINKLKLIPGLHVAAGVLNGAVAMGIVIALGEVSEFAYEQIYLGKKSLLDLDWLKQLFNDKQLDGIVGKITEVLRGLPADAKAQDVAAAVIGTFFPKEETQQNILKQKE